jgi:hypothetical protein
LLTTPFPLLNKEGESAEILFLVSVKSCIGHERKKYFIVNPPFPPAKKLRDPAEAGHGRLSLIRRGLEYFK